MELLKRLAAGFTGVALATLLVIGVASSQHSTETPLPPCPTEDSDNCFWDAQIMGNGEGRSFTVIDGVVTYAEPTPEELP